MEQIQASLSYLSTCWTGTPEDRRQYAQLKEMEEKRRILDDPSSSPRRSPRSNARRSAGTKPSQKMSEPVSRGKTLKELLGIEKEQG